MPQILITLAVTAGLSAAEYFLTPKVKQKPVDAGKMDDIRLMGSDYGAFIPRLLSGQARLAGNVIFSNGYQTFTTTTGATGGKKGGGQPATTNYIYKTSLGILVVAGQIGSFQRIWADNTLLINNSPAATGLFEAESATLSGGASSYTDATASSGHAVHGLGAGGKVSFNVSSVPSPVSKDPAETVTQKTRIEIVYKCSSDKVATVTVDGTPYTVDLPASSSVWSAIVLIVDGFAAIIAYEYASAATADLDCIQIEKYYEPVDPSNVPYLISGIASPRLAYPADLDDPSPYYNQTPANSKNGTTGTYAMTSSIPDQQVRFYTGTELQTQDASIVAWLDSKYGVGQGILRCSPMRSLAYLVIQDYTLQGSSLPNFTIEIDKGSNTLNEALATLFADVNIPIGYYDISQTSGLSQFGLLETQSGSRLSYIQELAKYHFFRLAEIDGKLITVADSYTSIGSISQTNLRAHMDGETMPDFDVTATIAEESLLPRVVSVSYMDPDLEYHNNAQLATVFASEVATATVEYSFPIIDPADQARNRSERLLLKSWTEANTFDYVGMPAEAKWAIGDVVTVPVGGVGQLVRIEKKSMPLPIGPVTFSCVSISPFNPLQVQDDVTTAKPKASKQFAQSTFPRNSVAFPIQSIPIRHRDRGRIGVYLAVCGRGRGDGGPIALYREMDAGDYVLEDVISQSSILGLCAGTLATWATPSLIDNTNTLDIWFFDDIDLETVTDTDIARLPQINLIRIGNEWVQFKTATALPLEDNSPYRSKWRISGLWRGRFGTTAAISTHAGGEYAALYTPTMLFHDLEREDIGQTVNLKAVTAGQAIAVASIASFTFNPVETVSGVASETLSRGMLVSLFDSGGGVLGVQKANATDNTKPADGYVVADVHIADVATVYADPGSVITGLSGLTVGADYFLSATGGLVHGSPPTGTGTISQRVGRAISATALIFEPEGFTTRA